MHSVVAMLQMAARRLLNTVVGDANSFLSEVKGVIHVGANLGQERKLYAKHELNVAWIEPIPEIFVRLTKLIADEPRQKAFNYLMTDVDDRAYCFHVGSNEGASSSIFDLAEHKRLWPEVSYVNTLQLKSTTLHTFVDKERLHPTDYDALVLDTQGSELLVLRGAVGLLPHIKYIKSEVADFESYAGCCRLTEMDEFLAEHNFRRLRAERFAHKNAVGSYFDVLYVATVPAVASVND